MPFCSLTKGISPKIWRLCFCVLINKRSLESFMCLDRVSKTTSEKQLRDEAERIIIGFPERCLFYLEPHEVNRMAIEE